MKYRFWIAVMPIDNCSFRMIDSKSFCLDEELLKLVEKYFGKRQVLLSAGLWDFAVGFEYVKQGEEVLVDSGGFQFYYLTPGRLRDFYERRKSFYKFQIKNGTYVIGGDIAVGVDLDEEQLRYYLGLTKENFEFQFSLGVDGSRFINVMHGVSPSNMKIWYEGVRGFPCAGWALGAKGFKVYSIVMQLLYLHQMGELRDGRLLHFFGMSGETTIPVLKWVCEQLGLNVVMSSDSSSFSLARFGGLFYKEGEIVRYKEIREGRAVELWDGTVLKDVPKKVDVKLARDLMLTGLMYFLEFVNERIVGMKEERLREVIKETEVDKILKWYKNGGIGDVYGQFRDKIIGVSEVRLVDRFELDTMIVNKNKHRRKEQEEDVSEHRIIEDIM